MDTKDIYIFDFVYTMPSVSNGAFCRHLALLNTPIRAFGGTQYALLQHQFALTINIKDQKKKTIWFIREAPFVDIYIEHVTRILTNISERKWSYFV
jgi:hypothetical protein